MHPIFKEALKPFTPQNINLASITTVIELLDKQKQSTKVLTARLVLMQLQNKILNELIEGEG